MADEYGLELAGTLGANGKVPAARPAPAKAAEANEQDELFARLNRLKATN